MHNITSPATDDSSIEAEIQAKGLTAPRVTPADVEEEIASEHYFTAGEAIAEVCQDQPEAKSPLWLLTFCVLVLRNGFTVTGESACASPENFDAEIGRKLARAKAVDKLWPLLGFRLRDKLASTPTDFRERVRLEAKDLEEKLLKLQVFLNSPTFEGLPDQERNYLRWQEGHMAAYLNVLYARIADFKG